tara:strand:+ start:3184 stop:4398 length:1215 start_codon:yes stop_codon:yes gene_type:complete
MEMIDVLKKLQEIANKSPEVEKAIRSVEATNPVTERPLSQGEENKKEKIVKSMKKDKEGFEKRYGDDAKAVMYATATKMAKKEDETNEGGMSDIHIGAQEVVGQYINDDGDLDMPKDQVLKAMNMEKAKAPFPRSYEIETAMQMIQDEFDDNGARKPDMEPAMDSEQPADEGNEFAQAVQKAKAAGMKAGDKFKVGDQEYTLKDSDFEQVNTNTMETKDKKEIKEAIQIKTDSPEEAGMMMQILKLAGIQPMGAEMPSMEPKPGSEMDPGELNKQMDAPETDGDEMAMYRNMVTKPDEEKQDETFDNEPNEKVQDVDTLVNVHSGGANKQKQQVRKEYPGDNPLAVEDKISEEELSNSLRTQYEDFKKTYQAEAKKAKPDFLDMDKDGNKKEPMKKAVKDKEAK